MPEETAVAEPVAPEVIAASVEAPASPEVTGEPQPQAESGDPNVLREFFRQHIKSPEELAAALEEVPEEYRAPIVSEYEKRGEQRRQTQEKEKQTARQSRLDAWQPYVEKYTSAEAYLTATMARAQAGDESAWNAPQLAAAINDYRNGAVGKVLLANEAYVPELVDSLLPEMTREEQQRLEKPLYDFARTGLSKDVVSAAMELYGARMQAKGYEAGMQKGLKDREAKAALAEKVQKIAEIQKQAPGIAVPGAQSSRESQLEQVRLEIADFDPAKFPPEERQSRFNELQARLRELQR